MSVSKSSTKARRHQSATPDLQPRNGQAVTGGKKAVDPTKVVQQQVDVTLQELQSAPK